jgi:hypothetical protein
VLLLLLNLLHISYILKITSFEFNCFLTFLFMGLTGSHRIEPDLIPAAIEKIKRVRPVLYYLNILDTIENMHSVAQRCV